jgi:hypothetical protein
MLRFHRDYRYTDRETKAKYVWLKYQPILKGRILNVGANQYTRGGRPNGL